MKLSDMNQSQLVEVYIQLRDRRAQRKAEFDNADADDKTKQEKIEGLLLKNFQETGAESVRTKYGTAYKMVKTSASIADWDTFFEYCRENEAWQLMGRHCSKDGVKEFRNANNDLPPGINWREELSIGVRRS